MSEREEVKKLLIKMFPEAATVEVFLNSQEIQIVPTYIIPREFTMRDVSGNWIKKE
jgi:hypothetical protein